MLDYMHLLAIFRAYVKHGYFKERIRLLINQLIGLI